MSYSVVPYHTKVVNSIHRLLTASRDAEELDIRTMEDQIEKLNDKLETLRQKYRDTCNAVQMLESISGGGGCDSAGASIRWD